MKDKTVCGIGIGGTVVAAICCFTPALVLLLGAVGLSAWLGWIDYVLFPTLAAFVAITAYGFHLRWRNALKAYCEPQGDSRS